MNRFFLNKCTRRLVLFVALPLALIFAQHRGSQADVGAANKCVPVEEGAWDCDVKELNNTQCAPDQKRDSDWKLVNSQDQAFELIKKRYAELQKADEFVAWLKCQGFQYVEASKGQARNNCLNCKSGIRIYISYSRKEFESYPESFFSLSGIFGWGVFKSITIYINDIGNIYFIEELDTL